MDKSKQTKIWCNKKQSWKCKKKKKNLQTRPNRKNLVTSGESNELLQDIEHCKITYKEAVKKLTNILNDINMSLKLNSFTPNQSKMINILFMVDKVFTGISKLFEENNEGKLEFFEKKSDIERKESDEQPDTTDMPEWESKKPAAKRRNQERHRLKILTPDQILSRLPVTLTQLKKGNNSQNLKNKIRQLLHSLYRSKNLTKQFYKILVNII